MVILAVEVHADVVPVIVYVVVAIGETVNVFEVPNPPLHKYVVAPLAVSLVESPMQIGFAVDEMLIIGFGVTVIAMLAVFVQAPVVPVTVYVVVETGVTFSGFVEPSPLLH